MAKEEKTVVTIKDIAEEVGVSRGTVDRALNHRGRVSRETAKRIRETAERMGYQKSIAGAGLAARKKKFQLGFLYFDAALAPFHQLVCRAAKEKARELAQYGVKVHFVPIHGFTKADRQDFADFVKEHREIAGWVAVGSMTEELYRIWEQAGMPPVPVVTYNMDCEEPSNRICFVGCDYRKAGRLACGLAALMSQEKGKVLAITEDPGNIPSAVQRLEGFCQEMEAYPAMELAGNLHAAAGEMTEDVVKALHGQIVREIRQDPEINVIYLMNPGDYRVCDIIQKAEPDRRFIVITNDLVTEEQKKMIRDGRIAAVVDQEPRKQGSRPLQILFQLLAMDRAPESDWIPTRLSVIIRQNMDE